MIPLYNLQKPQQTRGFLMFLKNIVKHWEIWANKKKRKNGWKPATTRFKNHLPPSLSPTLALSPFPNLSFSYSPSLLLFSFFSFALLLSIPLSLSRSLFIPLWFTFALLLFLFPLACSLALPLSFSFALSSLCARMYLLSSFSLPSFPSASSLSSVFFSLLFWCFKLVQKETCGMNWVTKIKLAMCNIFNCKCQLLQVANLHKLTTDNYIN